MEEGKKTCLCNCGCKCAPAMGAGCSNGCANCGMGYGYGHHVILRIVLGLAILAVVFWMGVKLGELKSDIYNRFSYEHGMMYSGYQEGAPMMTVTNTAPAGTAIPQ